MFFKNRRFYQPSRYDTICCSLSPCLWCAALLLWAAAVVVVAICWNFDFFRPVLFLSPVLVTLLCTFCTSALGVQTTPRRLLGFSLIMFMVYWTVYKAYPSQCRSAWGFKMVSDHDFISNSDRLNSQVLQHMRNIYASSEVDGENDTVVPAVRSLVRKMMQVVGQSAKGPAEQPGSNATTAASIPSVASSGFVGMRDNTAEEVVETLKEVLKDTEQDWKRNATKKWLMPWSDGDTFDNFVLRAYCDLHRGSQELPHVYPLRVLGIGPMEVPFRVACTYGSCILTEPRELSVGKLVFLWMLMIPAFGNLLIARVAGQCHQCWQWLWACLLPLWLVAFIESMCDMQLLDLVRSTVINLPKLIKGGEGDQIEQERVMYLLLVVLALALVYYFRDRIRVELGLHEWMPFLFSNHRVAGLHTFQVCVWKVDARTRAEQDEEAEPASEGGWQRLQALWLSPTSIVCGGGGLMPPKGYSYTALFGNVGKALPDSISVRLCYGGEELQRTRVQRVAGAFSDAYLFRENFTLGLERRPGALFTVEIQGQNGAGVDFSSTVNFNADRLERAFQRSTEAAAKPGYVLDQPIADTQVMKMRSFGIDEGCQERMANLGFHHYTASSGGEIWLAFCDIEDDGGHGWL